MSADGFPSRGPDRRQAPRREADRRLHYAREALIAQALEVADHEATEGPTADLFESVRELRRRASNYRAAEAGAFQESLDLG